MMRTFILLLLSFLLGTPAAAADLARMFFTPAQRATLDNARKQNIRIEIGNDGEQQPQTSAPVPHNISVNGLIKRSDGKNTIWLNNRIVNEQQPGGIHAAAVKSDNRVRLNVPESGRNIDLKVGQNVEIVSGTIEESYLRRPAPKVEAKAVSAGENSGSDVPKGISAKTRENLTPEVVTAKKSTRVSDRDAKDDSRPDNGTVAK